MYGISIDIWLMFMVKYAKNVGKKIPHMDSNIRIFQHLQTKQVVKQVDSFWKRQISRSCLKKKTAQAASQASLLIASGTCHRLHKQCLQQQRLAPLGPAKLCRSKNGAMSSAEKRRFQAWQVRMNQWWIRFHHLKFSLEKNSTIPMYSSNHHLIARGEQLILWESIPSIPYSYIWEFFLTNMC